MILFLFQFTVSFRIIFVSFWIDSSLKKNLEVCILVWLYEPILSKHGHLKLDFCKFILLA